MLRYRWKKKSKIDQQDDTPTSETSLNEDTEALFRQLSDLTPLDITHDEYIDIDSCVHTTAELSITEIVDEIINPDEEREEEHKDEENAAQEPIITVNQATFKSSSFSRTKGNRENNRSFGNCSRVYWRPNFEQYEAIGDHKLFQQRINMPNLLFWMFCFEMYIVIICIIQCLLNQCHASVK